MKPISAVFIPEHDDIDGEILMISAYMDQGKSGSSTHVPKMSNFAILALISCLFTTSRGDTKCNSNFLDQRCKKLFKGSYASECHGEALQLFPKCLFMASECKRSGQITQTSYTHSANANYSEAYDLLIQRVKLYRRCFARNAQRCNESMIKDCYENFERNKTQTCREVHKLRFCILLLRPRGCHEMRNPWYTLAIGIIKSYKSCFIQNYTILLETLNQKKPVPHTETVELQANKTKTTLSTCAVQPAVSTWNNGYMFFAAMFICFVIICISILLFICVKRTGIPLKGRRSLLPTSDGSPRAETDLLETRQARTCVTDGQTPLTYVIEEDEAPPPYFVESYGTYIEGVESPPPYTSRPTSVNGDFV